MLSGERVLSPQSILFRHTVKESARSRHARLRLSLREGLVVVVPPGFARENIAQLLEEKRPWIEKTARKLEALHRLFEPETKERLPETIELAGIDEHWRVDYQKTGSGRVVAFEQDMRSLTLCGNTDHGALCKAVLRRCLTRKAYMHLVPWLKKLSEETGTAFQGVTVRSQRTRWGSCSWRKTISLNLRLLFIPEPLVHHVLLHELCHLVHLDHSSRFWALVERHDPDFAVKNKALRQAWTHVPAWLD